jgi:hypothetical protein
MENGVPGSVGAAAPLARQWTCTGTPEFTDAMPTSGGVIQSWRKHIERFDSLEIAIAAHKRCTYGESSRGD